MRITTVSGGLTLILASSVTLAAQAASNPVIRGLSVYAGQKYIGALFAPWGDYGEATMVSPKGFLFSAHRDTGVLGHNGQNFYYSNTSCTGEVYVDGQSESGFNFRWANGWVFRVDTAAFYVAERSTASIHDVASSYNNFYGCQTFTTFQLNGIALLPNDPAVTGVSGVNLGGMLSFGDPL